LNNPQHRRVLVNEWLGCAILQHAGILTPETRIVHISEEFVRDYPDMHFQLKLTRPPPVAGFHFGSRFPGHPDHLSVYDFVPDWMFACVANRADFLGALVLDKWMANADARQAIFYRQPTARHSLVASMIDNGLLFGGPHWDFVDAPLFGLARSRAAYADVSVASLEPWFNLVGSFPEEVLSRAARQMPPEWLEGDQLELAHVIETLLSRRARVPDLVLDTLRVASLRSSLAGMLHGRNRRKWPGGCQGPDVIIAFGPSRRLLLHHRRASLPAAMDTASSNRSAGELKVRRFPHET
jgi:hypothetical protein